MARPLLTRIAFRVVAIAALVGVGVAVPAQGSGGPTADRASGRLGLDGLIAYVDSRSSRGVSLVDPRTSERVPGRGSPSDWGPDFSPDGQLIALDGSRGLTVMNANGTDARTIFDGGLVIAPRFSADGKRVWFTSRLEDGGYDLYSVRLDGAGLRKEIEIWEGGSSPSFSPNGRLVAFEHGAGGPDDWDIALLDTRTEERIDLTADASSLSPAFSPDGSRIAFVRQSEGGSDIYTMDPDGSDVEQVTSHPAPDRKPTWSPDGEQIAFSSTRDGRGSIYVIDATGENERELTPDESRRAKYAPDWSVADEVAPRTRFRSPPHGALRENPRWIRFAAREAVTRLGQVRFRCRVDSGPERSCDSPLRVGSLGPGRHRVEVFAIDRAGNRDGTPAVARWRVRR